MCASLAENEFKVSIVVPMYNVEQYLERCVESVLNQTNASWELILVNDGSTDNTLEIANQFSKIDQRIRVIDGENQGVSCARNKGLEEAKGEILVFLDADDWIENYYVDSILENWEDSTDVIVFDYYESDALNEKNHMCCFDKTFYNYEDGARFYLLSLLGYYEHLGARGVYRLRAPWAKAYRVDIIRNFAYFLPTVKLGEDAAFNIQVFSRINKVKYVELPVYNYFINPNSVVRKIHFDISGLVKGANKVLNYVYGVIDKQARGDMEIQKAWGKYIISWMNVCISRMAMTDDWRNVTEARLFLHECASYLHNNRMFKSLTFGDRLIVHMCYYKFESVVIQILRWRK